MKRYTLKSLVQNGSHARKKIKSDVIIGDTNNGYGVGDILDANATMEQVNSKIDDVLGVNAENINSLVEILNDDDATTGILSQLNAKQDAITSDNKLSADLVADGTTNKAFTAAEKTKLSDIATGAEVNVQSDWNQTNTSADDYIKNKPTNVSAFTNDAGYLTENSTVTIDMTDTNGHEYVDLGLPSGTLWATMNVGASSETDYGNYYQYGKGAAQYSATSGDSNYSGTEDPLDSSVDTAAQVWGGSWRMPTREQMQELTANTTYEWVTNYKGSGINGGTFTAINGAVLFIPAAGLWNGSSQYLVGDNGLYWGSSPLEDSDAYLLNFYDGYEGVYSNLREYGYSVRPVIEPSTVTKTVKQILTDAATAAIAAQQ